jgi:hypothetical protein
MLAVLVAATLLSTASISATSIVRGQVVRVGPQGQSFPAAGIAVRVFNSQRGPSGFTYTGNDGMYYLYNIPPGDYALEVWLSPDPGNRLVFNIRVYDQAYTDIAPIRVP